MGHIWMRTTLNSRTIIGLSLLIVLTSIAITNAVQSDIDCLKSIKASLEDPENFLSSWDFSNNTEGFICRFIGVECWHPNESKVLNIRLPDMGLKGGIPAGLKNCTSMTGLDLSNNNLNWPLPSNMSDVLHFVTKLDLSSNNLSGEIPASIANCSYLNVLRLENNHFTGQIPLELDGLKRIKDFSVANNRLTGQVPTFTNANFTGESYICRQSGVMWTAIGSL